MEKQKMTDTLWKELEEKSKGIWFFTKFLIDEDEIQIQKKVVKDKFEYLVFINGQMKGAEIEENKEKYWFEKRFMITKKQKDYYLGMAKLCKGEEKKKFQELAKQTVSSTYLIPYFGSFKALKSAYKKDIKRYF